MTRKRRVMSGLLAAAMLMSCIPAYAAGEEEDITAEESGTTTVITDEDVEAAEEETAYGSGAEESEEPTAEEDAAEADGTEAESAEADSEETSEEEDGAAGSQAEDAEDTYKEESGESDGDTLEEEEEDATHTVTFDLGDSTLSVAVGEDGVIAAEDIPETDAEGNEILRWYSSDLSEEVDPEELIVTADLTLVSWVAPELTDSHDAYMNGYGNGYFGPDDTLTWSEIAQILYNLLADQSLGSFPSGWADVNEDDWYYTAVTVVSSLGLFDCDGGNFNPADVITRAEFVGVVAQLADSMEEVENPFSDVDESSPYYDDILTAYALGWVEGTGEGTFDPDGSLTRAEVVTIFNRILNREIDADVLASGEGLRSFADVSESSWYYAAVMEATIDHTEDTSGDSEVWLSYTHTYTVTFVYGSSTTAQEVYEGDTCISSSIPTKTSAGTEIARWTVNSTNVMGDPYVDEITEDTTYTAWFSPELETDHIAYVEGYGDGSFGPDDTLTRSEACQMVYNLLADQSTGSYYSYFSDVSSDSWYYEAVNTLASLDLITATGGEYDPEGTMSRAEFVELISRFTALSHTDCSYTDVDEDDEYYYAICTATAMGWVEGTGESQFSPDGLLTRAEAVTILNRIMGRYGDSDAEYDMDDRYTFDDVSTSHWAYVAIMEAATVHEYTVSGTTETWSSYSHAEDMDPDWEDSDSVVEASTIVLEYSSTYSGDYTNDYNIDYSTQAKEDYVNSKGYSSSTSYLVWVSRACQKVYIFTGSQYNWTLYDTFICATGKSSTPTPVGVTYITYKQSGWYHSTYQVEPVIRFYPGTG